MITPDDVIMALSWSGETAELKDLTDYSRRFKIGLIAVTAFPDSALAQAADVVVTLPQAREACPHNLAPDHLHADAAGARRRARDRAPGEPRFHRGEIRRTASGRPARRHAEIRARRHAHRRRHAARRARHPHVGGAGGDDRQEPWLRDHHRCRRPARRHHHRRRSAAPHERGPAEPAGRADHDGRAENGAAGSARERGAGIPQRDKRTAADRRRGRQARRRRARRTICCARESPDLRSTFVRVGCDVRATPPPLPDRRRRRGRP